MIAWLNLILLIAALILTVAFYVRSVGPAALEQKIGPGAYEKCARYRLVSGALMFVEMVAYGVYFFHPLPIPLPRTFPWPWWVSALIGLAIAIPSVALVWRGMRDAGGETMRPRREHALFGGIYDRVRHPQWWEALLWFTFAFLLHSPFLVLFSFLWLPAETAMVMAEERDLIIRFGQPYQEYRQRTPAFLPRRRRPGTR